jgi:uncharacterized protein DUF3489
MDVSKTQPVVIPASDSSTKPAAKPQRSAASRVRKPVGKKSKASAPRPGTQTAKILRLLKRPNGASLGELTKATGWQPHSVRGFLSGVLKTKMRLKVTSSQREDHQRAYRLASK